LGREAFSPPPEEDRKPFFIRIESLSGGERKKEKEKRRLTPMKGNKREESLEGKRAPFVRYR